MSLGPPWADRVHFSILRLRTQFRAATRKERPCFAAECGPDRFGHTRALQGPFFDPKTQNPKARSHEGFRAATRTERRVPRHWHLAQAKMHILRTEFGTAKSAIFFQVYGGRSRLYSSHTKRTALFCCRMWLGPPRAHRDTRMV